MKRILCVFLTLLLLTASLPLCTAGAAQTGGETGAPAPYPCFSFICNEEWENIYVQAWTGDRLLYEEPGRLLTDNDLDAEWSNKVGAPYYFIEFPEYDIDCAWFTDGCGNYTDLALSNEWWCLYYTNGNYNGGTARMNCRPSGYACSGKITFINSLGWDSIHVMSWNSYGETSLWEDCMWSMQQDPVTGETSCEIWYPGYYEGIVISDGKGNQTMPITNLSNDAVYYADGSQNANGCYYVYPKSYATAEIGQNLTFTLTDAAGWDKMFLFTADGTGVIDPEAGERIMPVSVNEKGQNVYTVTVPDGTETVRFGDGSGRQTEDITALQSPAYTIAAEQTDAGTFRLLRGKAQVLCPACHKMTEADDGLFLSCTNEQKQNTAVCMHCQQEVRRPDNGYVIGHNYVRIKGTEAASNHTGLTQGERCSRCGEWRTAQEVIPALITGDINQDGELTINDATELQRYLAELTMLSPEALVQADRDNNGYVNIKDVTEIQRKLAGLC